MKNIIITCSVFALLLLSSTSHAVIVHGVNFDGVQLKECVRLERQLWHLPNEAVRSDILILKNPDSSFPPIIVKTSYKGSDPVYVVPSSEMLYQYVRYHLWDPFKFCTTQQRRATPMRIRRPRTK